MITKTSSILSKEHEYILKVIAKLLSEIENIEHKKVDEKLLKDSIEFIRNYADKLHHAKEEDLLFKEFIKKANETHCNPIEQMLYEHEQGRNFVRQIEHGLKQRNVKLIIEGITGYGLLLQDHISKEDDVLYPMCDEILDEKTNKELYKKFVNIDNLKEKEKNKYEKFALSLK